MITGADNVTDLVTDNVNTQRAQDPLISAIYLKLGFRV